MRLGPSSSLPRIDQAFGPPMFFGL